MTPPERHAGTGTNAGRDAADAWLVAVGRARDRAAFARLFAAFAPRIKAYLLRQGADRAAADELVQEVMMLVWRRAETFDPVQASAATWMFTIARNKRIDALRRERRPEIDAQDLALVPEPAESADRRIEATQSGARLRKALEDLPPEQAELLRQAYYEGKPHSLIAEESGLPLGTVKSRIRLALGRLRIWLKDS
ncbi:MAG TPA: sigma-70 family RNA polymerase sigma factor [Azospirillaceae bacterium]|nr:sigma-70 family RNA polymerase sigma factor [Azospirillaceae bacterium]